MKRKLVLAGSVVVGAFMLFMCAGSLAKIPTNVTVSAQVPATIQLDMPTTTVNWDGKSLEPGGTYTQTISATINSNKGWTLSVYKDHDLTGTGGTPETIPSADLTYTSASSDTRVTSKRTEAIEFPVQEYETWVVKGTRGSGITSTITYSLTVPWDLAPDTYTATHTYTATQP